MKYCSAAFSMKMKIVMCKGSHIYQNNKLGFFTTWFSPSLKGSVAGSHSASVLSSIIKIIIIIIRVRPHRA